MRTKTVADLNKRVGKGNGTEVRKLYKKLQLNNVRCKQTVG